MKRSRPGRRSEDTVVGEMEDSGDILNLGVNEELMETGQEEVELRQRILERKIAADLRAMVQQQVSEMRDKMRAQLATLAQVSIPGAEGESSGSLSIPAASSTAVSDTDKGPQRSWSDVIRISAVVTVFDPNDNVVANRPVGEDVRLEEE